MVSCCQERLDCSKTDQYRIGFGRKMYTDYEIVCKVRLGESGIAVPLTTAGLLRLFRPTSPRSNFDTPWSAAVILILKPSVIFLNTNRLVSTFRRSQARFSQTGSPTRLSRLVGRDWSDS